MPFSETTIHMVTEIYIQHYRYRFKTAKSCRDFIAIRFRDPNGSASIIYAHSPAGGEITIHPVQEIPHDPR